jgi:hypothetical protein
LVLYYSTTLGRMIDEASTLPFQFRRQKTGRPKKSAAMAYTTASNMRLYTVATSRQHRLRGLSLQRGFSYKAASNLPHAPRPTEQTYGRVGVHPCLRRRTVTVR